MFTLISPSTTLPLSLTVTKDDVGGVTGLSPTVAVRRLDNEQYLDWNDLTFKASGWTTKQEPLTDLGAGTYQTSLALTPFALPAGLAIAAEYTLPGPANLQGTDVDLFLVSQDSLTLDRVRQALFNKQSALGGNPGTLTTYKDDGVTPLVTYTLQDYALGPVFNTLGVPAVRGAGVFP